MRVDTIVVVVAVVVVAVGSKDWRYVFRAVDGYNVVGQSFGNGGFKGECADGEVGLGSVNVFACLQGDFKRLGIGTWREDCLDIIFVTNYSFQELALGLDADDKDVVVMFG